MTTKMPYKPNNYTLHPMSMSVLGVTLAQHTRSIHKLMRDIFNATMFRFADGMPLVWFSKMVMKQCYRCCHLLLGVAAMAAEKCVNIFLLGGNPGVADHAADQLMRGKFRSKDCGDILSAFWF